MAAWAMIFLQEDAIRRRWLFASLGAALALAAAWAAQRVFDTSSAWRHLRDDAGAAFAPAHARPSHVDAPLAGTFGQRLEPHLGELERLREELQRVDPEDACGKAVTPDGSDLEIPSLCMAHLEAARPVVREALLASRAESADPPGSTDWLASGVRGPPHELGGALSYLAKVTALDVRTKLEGGDSDGAVTECLDVLAAGRDASYGALVGAMVGRAVVGRMTWACAAAVQSAPREGRRRAARELLVIRDGWESLEGIVRRECPFGGLAFAGQLYPDALDTLPKAAADVAREDARYEAAQSGAPGFFARLLLRAQWRALDAECQAWLDASRRPSEFRLAAADTIDSGRRFDPFRPSNALEYRNATRRYEGGLDLLDLLVAVADDMNYFDEQKRWPEESVPRARDATVKTRIHLEPHDGTAELIAHLPGNDVPVRVVLDPDQDD